MHRKRNVSTNESSCHHCHGTGRTVLGAMVMKQPVKNLFAAIGYTRNRLIVYFAAALIGLVVFINFFFSSLVSRRIQLLEEKTSRVAAGDVTVEVVDDHRDSIGKLSLNFNQMVKSIRDRMEYADSLKLGIVDPFFMVDPEMNVTFINENAARLSGMPPDKAIGRPCHEVFHSSACDKGCPVKKALDTGELTEAKRMVITDRNGKDIPAMAISSVLKDSSGKVLGAFEIIRDLTAEVEAENSLQEAYLREGKAKQELEKKVEDLSGMLNQVANGDFTVRGTLSGTEDSMDMMTKRINETLDSIVNLIAKVKSYIIPVIREVTQISEGNQSLSQRTQQQASAMEEMSATLEQLVSNTTENLINTRHADSLSKDAVKVAQDGVEEVEKTSHAMVEMSNASHKIFEMVELINEITFQTNLLSINAAIEAARAGEQGLGFAVVATEIRDLAKRSGAASKDIQTLVKEIMGKVTATGQWVEKLKECFTKIVQTSRQVSDALGEVTIGNEESSKGIEQISHGTQELSDVNEKNAYFVEEISQETRKLAEKAQQLHNITGVFILGDKERGDKEEQKKEDLLTKPSVDDVNEDFLEKEFEKGFEEF